jgi:hypothetical protein
MLTNEDLFQRSVNEQIAINRARTPGERFQALCDLLDAARGMAPTGPEAEDRRRRAESVRQRDREQWRDEFRQFIAAQRAKNQAGA